MVTMAPIRPEVKVLVTYPLDTLDNDHIFVNEIGTYDIIKTTGSNIPSESADMIRTAIFNIPTGSGFYILEDSDDNPFLNVEAGYFSSFDLDDNTATFGLHMHTGSENKKVIENIMSNPNDYELFVRLSGRITKNRHFVLNKGGGSFFFLKNKRYIISREIKLITDGKHKAFITWKER